MNRTLVLIALSMSSFLFLTDCKKKYDTPPLQPIAEGAELFIANLKSRVPLSGKSYKLSTGDSSLYCTVTADEVSGNIFKQVFVKDDAGDAMQLNLITSGGLFTGDRIRINTNGLYMVNLNNMIYLDSVDIIKNTLKLSSGNNVVPVDVSLQSLLLQSAAGKPSTRQSQLVRISDVEFIPNAAHGTFADPVSKSSVDQVLKDCESNRLLVRSSGYANFAGKPLPNGNGVISGILTQYNDRLQLTIRNYKEINMSGPLCSVTHPTTNPSVLYLKKDFNDNNLTSGAWTSYTVTNNSVNWSVTSFSTTASPFAKISGFVNGSNTQSETWLISPQIDLSTAGNPYLSFLTAAKYPGNVLEVLACNNFNGGSPSSSDWISLSGSYTLSPAPQTGGYTWTPSGKVDLSAYKSNTTRIAFKYTSTPAGSTTYELDDIFIQED